MRSAKRSTLLFRAALLSAACALAAVPPGAAGQEVKLSSMLGGAVTFTLPAGWHVSMLINSLTGGGAEIRNTEKVSASPQARLFLSARPLREKKTVGEMIEDTFGSHLRNIQGGTVLSDTSDGEDWRTVVWTKFENGQPYLMLEHFGVVNDKFADLTVVVPLGLGDVKWMKQAVEDFNAACESLKIDGKGTFESKVSPDVITEQLKVNARK
jgi:hypothetical protein